MKLLSFFKLTYLLPSSIYVVISIIIAFLCLITFLKDYINDKHIDEVSNLNCKNDWVLISSIHELLYHRIQNVFDYLISSKLYLDKFHSEMLNSAEPFPNINLEEYFKKYLINLKTYYTGENPSENLDQMAYNNNDGEPINKINFDEISSKESMQIKYIYLYSRLIPLFKSFYKNFENKQGFSIDSFYIMNRKTETFGLYPIKKYDNYEQIFNFYNEIKNPNNCRNKNRKIPNYFYSFCREAFKNIENTYKHNHNRTMFITYPYNSLFQNESQKDNVISICHIFNFTMADKEDFDDYYLLFVNDEIVICADIIINNYYTLLMNFEDQLEGFFYITKTNSRFPLFFPRMNDDPYPNDITRFVFNFSYSDFDATNVVNFNMYILPKLIKEYNDTDLILNNELSNENNKDNNILIYSVNNTENLLKKGDLEYKYFIYPIFFNNDEIKEHVLSIIYVVDKNRYKNQLNSLSSKLNPLIYLGLIMMIGFGIIIILILHYIIYVFSMNITKPIKIKLKQNAIINKKKINKYSYQGIDMNNLVSLGLILKKAKKHKVKSEQDEDPSINDFDRNSNDIFGRYIYGNENLLKKNKEKENEQENKEDNENDNKNNIDENESDDEEQIPLLIDSQFNDKVNLLYELNKVRSFMRGEQVHLKGSNITKFISCQSILKEMKDKLGENICLSNVGNLENLNNKYDKAIIFFSKSLNLENTSEEIHSEEILKIVDKFFDKEQKPHIVKELSSSLLVNMNKSKPKKEEKGKKKKALKEEVFDENNDLDDIQFHRFIKLFYAYNMYFSNVKTIENILNKTLHMSKTKKGEESYIYHYVKSVLVFFTDYFNMDITKVHKNYKNAILICLQRLIESKTITKKKEKILYCYVELFHYYIAYLKIFIKRMINHINEYNDEDETDNKNKLKTVKNMQNKHIKKFKQVVKIARKSADFILKMKTKIGISKKGISEGEKNKYKEFLNELQKIEEKNHNIEFNIYLIEQKYDYYFAKFSKLCGDYSTALNYYLKVIDDQRLISNGILCLKANKKICNIINYARYNSRVLAIHEKDEKKIQEIYEKCKKQIKELQKVDYKDLIIIFDKSYKNKDIEKVYRLHIQQYKAITNIIDNYISTNDRFCLYTYGNENFNFEEEEDEDIYINYIRNNSIKKLIGLCYKNNDNNGFINGIIEGFHENVINEYEQQSKMKQMYLNTEQSKNFSLNGENKDKNKNLNDYFIYKMKLKSSINIIFKVINEANIIEEQRKKYVIFITESFKDELNAENKEKFNVKELFKEINYISKSKIEKLYIIGSLLDETNLFNEISYELSNHGIKNEYIEFENISELNKKFQSIGTLPRKYEYFNEKLNI